MHVSSSLPPHRLSVVTHGSSPQAIAHPWPTGYTFESPGAHLTYRVIGPCCRLYDRDQLPWPACRIQWRSKEPSWRRIGKQFIVDMATRKHPSYCVEIVGQSYRSRPIVMTLYTAKLRLETQNWWHTKRVGRELEEKPEGEPDGRPIEERPPEQRPPEEAEFKRL